MAQEMTPTESGTVAGATADAGQRSPRSTRPVGSPTSGAPRHASLQSERGSTRIADGVVAKIAGLAAREIPGVQEMGKGFARTVGGLRSLVPGGAPDSKDATQGVSVAVGEREAAIDLDIVTYYGQSIVEVTEAVRRNVIERIESMTGLEVKEVNIMVDDLHVDDDSAPQEQESRVQ
ncbi:MAG: Asp23/Gls24 family envelope stress response protein [Candidatus Dormibacteraeota bacterium]|nr:Asp23/Gls24 family envelope stress response protein [Candidatus Dormibacteraeota bacterium]